MYVRDNKSKARFLAALAMGACLATNSSAVGQNAPAGAPDLSGVWQRTFPGNSSLMNEMPMTDWASERFALAKPLHGPRTASATEANAAEIRCLPMGFPGYYYRPRPFEIFQLSDRVLMLFEVDNFWRVIHLDGRDFAEVPLHTWNGTSIGHYEGDTLVVETRHILGWESETNQRWLDRLGHPFSDELVLTERIRRVDDDNMEIEVTVEDPIAYSEPVTGTLTFGTKSYELAEFVCNELMLSQLPEMRPEQ